MTSVLGGRQPAAGGAVAQVATVAVIGSRASRDVFNPHVNSGVENYYALGLCQLEPSVLSLASPPVPFSTADYRRVTGEALTNLQREVTKGLEASLTALAPDFILVDFFADVYWGCLDLGDGRYLTRTTAFQQTRYYRQLRRDQQLVEFRLQRESERYLQLWRESFDWLITMLRRTAPSATVILNPVRVTDMLRRPGLRGQVALAQHRPVPKLDVSKTNDWLARLDAEARSIAQLEVLQLPESSYPSSDDHPTGAGHLNFVPEYYRDVRAALHSIRLDMPSATDFDATRGELKRDAARVVAARPDRSKASLLAATGVSTRAGEWRPDRRIKRAAVRRQLSTQYGVKTVRVPVRVKRWLRSSLRRSPQLERAWVSVRRRVSRDKSSTPAVIDAPPRFGPVTGVLETLRWVSDATVELGGWVYSQGVDATVSKRPRLDIWLEPEAGGPRVLAVTVQRPEPEANITAKDSKTDYSGSGFVARLDLADAVRRTPGPWRVRYRLRFHHPYRIDGSFTVLRSEGSAGGLISARLSDGTYLQPRWSDADGLEFAVQPSGPEKPTTGTVQISSFTVGEDERAEIRLSGAIVDRQVSRLSVGLSGPQGFLDSSVLERTGSAFGATIPLWRSSWGGPELPPVLGNYYLVVKDDGQTLPAPLIDDCLATLPKSHQESQMIVRLERSPAGSGRVAVRPPLKPSEVGAYAQARFRQRFTETRRRRDGSIYFETFYGRSATDSPRAIYDELVRRGETRPMYWGVTDYSISVPDGSKPILKGSNEWWRLLSRASYFVHNCGAPRVLRPGKQVVLQTWHGTPLKLLGMDGLGRGGSESRAGVLSMTSSWSYLLAQNPYSAEIFQRAYLFDGPILELGYPRNDTLVWPTVSEAEVRHRIGVSPDSKIVLYAPTWRDGDASLVGYLDAPALAKALGEEFVVLVRGHNHTLHAGRREHASRVVDVTAYPQVNELLTVADVMITDYSSLMFDYSVTGKPMVFFVPDLEHYRDERRGLYFDLAAESPGPVLRTQDEVVDALRAVPSLQKEYAERYERWRCKFNPRDDGKATSRVVDAVFGPDPVDLTTAPEP
jgi:CDP-glycerol glycerophosphotransferase (TagB/SpsB family)